MFWGLPDPHPDKFVKDLDPDPDPSFIMHRGKFSLNPEDFALQFGDSWRFGADPDLDPHLSLMDPDPTPNLTPFFGDTKDEKKKFIFFSYSLPAGKLYSVLKIWFFAKILC